MHTNPAVLCPRAGGPSLLQGDFISPSQQHGLLSQVTWLFFANPNSGAEIQEEILQEGSGAELGAQDWEQSSSHVCPQPPWTGSHQGNSATMENLKFLNFTKHLHPVALRNCDRGKEVPRTAALSAGAVCLCGFPSLCSRALLWAPALLGEDDPW